MHCPDRNIDRLVLMYGGDCVIQSDSRRTFNYNPVLGSVIVLLERKPLPWLNNDTLHLMALALINRLIRPPWSMHLKVLCCNLRRSSS